MRIKHKVRVHIAEDTDMKNLRFAPDDALSEVQIDTYGKQFNGDFSVVSGADEILSLGDIAAVKGFYLEVNKDCQLTLNGGATPLQLRRGNSGTDDKAKVFIECDVTEIKITAQADDVTGAYAVWGTAS